MGGGASKITNRTDEMCQRLSIAEIVDHTVVKIHPLRVVVRGDYMELADTGRDRSNWNHFGQVKIWPDGYLY